MNNDESIKQKAEALKSPRMQKALSEIERILKEMEIKRELKRMKQKTITIASSKMRKIKTVYSTTPIMNNDKSIKQKAEALIGAFEKAYEALPGSVGRVGFRYSPNITDAKPFRVLSQYGDFFFILPNVIGTMELPILEVLLSEPFNGKLYSSHHDGKLQIRVSGFTEIE